VSVHDRLSRNAVALLGIVGNSLGACNRFEVRRATHKVMNEIPRPAALVASTQAFAKPPYENERQRVAADTWAMPGH
jgi:hypothetical protein